MALTRDKQILIAAVVLAGLGTAVYFQQKKDARVGQETLSSAQLPSISGPEDVDKVEITNGEKTDVVLEKKDDKWWVTKPVNAVANQTNVKQLVDNMKELKVTEVVTTNATDDLKKGYELDAAKAVHVVASKAGDKKVDDYFGKSGSRGEMMMVNGNNTIYSASSFSVYLYNRDVRAWRDTEVLKFDDATANTATIENAHGVFSFTKANDKWSGTFNGKPIERFDEEKVKSMLGTFKSLNAEDFGDGKSAADTGLDKPEGTMTLTLKDNAGKFVVHVGKVSSGTSRYAQKDGSDTIYVIAGFANEYVTAEVSKFQKALDAGAPADAGTPPTRPPPMPHGHPPPHP